MIKVKLYDQKQKKMVTKTVAWVDTFTIVQLTKPDLYELPLPDYVETTSNILADVLGISAEDLLKGVKANEYLTFVSNFVDQAYGLTEESKKAESR